ncbi:MAG: DUF7670 domain-containing protein [Planctomycetota bacterium]|jgi:hypothetical protein
MAASTQTRTVVRWVARLIGAASFSMLLLFIVAHIFEQNTGRGPTPSEWFGLMFFPGGVTLGLGIALFRPRLGAMLSLGSLAVFYSWHFIDAGFFPGGPWFFLFTSPAILYLISSWLDGTASTDAQNREPGSPTVHPKEPGRGLGTHS